MTKTYADVCLDRAEKATEGPWNIKTKHDPSTQITFKYSSISSTSEGPVILSDGLTSVEDAEFIAHSRTDVPELARRLKRAIEIIEFTQKAGACDDAIFELEAMPEG